MASFAELNGRSIWQPFRRGQPMNASISLQKWILSKKQEAQGTGGQNMLGCCLT
jgi:hypothetical protein